MAVKTIELEDAGLRYRLYFLKQAFDKMRLYVELCEDEIGWLGYVEKLQDDQGYVVTDVFLLDQEVHGATTELSPDAIIKYYNELDDAGRENFLNKCRIWGHSHVNMSPSPSGQDDTQGAELSKDVNDFYIRLITNKKGEYNITFYDKTIKAKVTTDEIVLYNPEGNELRKQIQQEIKDKVKRKTYTAVSTLPSYNTYSSTKRYWDNDDVKKSNSIVPVKKDKKKKEVSKIDIKDIFDKDNYYSKLFEQVA